MKKLNLYSFKATNTLFVIIILVCSLLNMVYMHTTICNVEPAYLYRFNYISNFYVLIDVFALYIIPLLTVKKNIKIYFIPYFVLTLLVWINVGYSRYFDTYVPVTMYASASNLKGFSRNIIDAIELSDFFLAFTTAFVLIAYYFCRKDKTPVRKYPLYIMLALGVILFVRYAHYVHNSAKANWNIGEKSLVSELKLSYQFTKPVQRSAYFNYGLSINYIYDLISNQKKPFPSHLTTYLKSDRNVTESAKKNFILILVESFSSFPIGKSYGGKEITPNINDLIKSGAKLFPHVESEEQLGESSDGQFIYMTGILPFKDRLTIETAQDNTLMALPHYFRKKSPTATIRMTIPNTCESWAQSIMCKKYGIDTLFCKENYPDDLDDDLDDELVFKYAASKDVKTDIPFFSTILTISMHSPYISQYLKEKTNISYPPIFSKEMCVYLDNVHFFDKWLGWYIKTLKDKAIFDDTTIMNKPNPSRLNMADASICMEIPLIVVNPSDDICNVNENTKLSQTSIFPTILDLWGVESSWRGVGYSLLYNGSKDRDKKLQQEISEALISSDYFKKK